MICLQESTKDGEDSFKRKVHEYALNRISKDRCSILSKYYAKELISGDLE